LYNLLASPPALLPHAVPAVRKWCHCVRWPGHWPCRSL